MRAAATHLLLLLRPSRFSTNCGQVCRGAQRKVRAYGGVKVTQAERRTVTLPGFFGNQENVS
jgi:hypothetical protein